MRTGKTGGPSISICRSQDSKDCQGFPGECEKGNRDSRRQESVEHLKCSKSLQGELRPPETNGKEGILDRRH